MDEEKIKNSSLPTPRSIGHTLVKGAVDPYDSVVYTCSSRDLEFL